jgi:NADPH:quinone reductase-like Zn-dependent oxidoreductase
MKAILISTHGNPDVLTRAEVPAPALSPDGVLVRVHFAALNHLDLWVRKGVPGHKFPLPMIPGCDMAGVVETIGALVTNLKPGDRVAVAPGFADPSSPEALAGLDHLARDYGIFGETRNGGCAELCDVPARNLMRVPDGVALSDAAAFPLTFLTAWGMLVRRAQIRPGESILIHAAGSGVSTACIKVAKLWNAGRVIVTAGTPEKCRRALDCGADIAINYREQDFLDAVRRETGKAGVDIVVDHIGPETIAKSLSCLKKGGRLVTCGSTSGGSAEINLRQVFFKSLSILGSTMSSRGDLVPLWEHFCAGRLRPVVDRVFPVRDIAAAHAHLESRAAFGKVVINMQEW